MNTALNIHTEAERNMLSCIPNVSVENGRNLTMINDKIDIRTVQNVFIQFSIVSF